MNADVVRQAIDEHRAWIRRIAASHAASAPVEDAFQEAVGEILTRANELSAVPEDLFQWITARARTAGQRVGREHQRGLASGVRAREEANLDAFPDPNASDPSEEAVAQERRRDARTAILGLDSAACGIAHAHFYRGVSLASIAADLGAPPSTIQSRYLVALELLHDNLINARFSYFAHDR